jgi:hypothetical protein
MRLAMMAASYSMSSDGSKAPMEVMGEGEGGLDHQGSSTSCLIEGSSCALLLFQECSSCEDLGACYCSLLLRIGGSNHHGLEFCLNSVASAA